MAGTQVKPPVSMTPRGRSLLIGALALLALWLLLQLQDIWLLVALLLAVLIVGGIWALSVGRLTKLQVQITLSTPTPSVGDQVAVQLGIDHRFPWTLHGNIGIQFGQEHCELQGIELTGTSALTTRWLAAHRGKFTVSISQVEIVDPLGVFSRRLYPTAQAEILVLPQLLPSLAAALHSGHGLRSLDGQPSGMTSLNESGAPSGSVREYRIGDAPRQIHWKQSARQGELLVNLPEPSTRPTHSLALLTERDLFATAESFEAAVSAAATVAVHWLSRNSAVTLWVGTASPMRCESPAQALRTFALVQESTATADFTGMQPGAQQAFTPQIIVTGTLTVTLADRLASLPHSGALIALDRQTQAHVPARWQAIALAPHLEASDD